MARCWGHVDPVKGCYHKDYTVEHEFTEAEAVRLLEWMSNEDWEDGPRCVRHFVDRVADGEWGYRPVDHRGSFGPIREHTARRQVYGDRSMILTYRPNPDAPWEDVLQWDDDGYIDLGPGPEQP